jgi:hypothetical protein
LFSPLIPAAVSRCTLNADQKTRHRHDNQIDVITAPREKEN